LNASYLKQKDSEGGGAGRESKSAPSAPTRSLDGIDGTMFAPAFVGKAVAKARDRPNMTGKAQKKKTSSREVAKSSPLNVGRERGKEIEEKGLKGGKVRFRKEEVVSEGKRRLRAHTECTEILYRRSVEKKENVVGRGRASWQNAKRGNGTAEIRTAEAGLCSEGKQRTVKEEGTTEKNVRIDRRMHLTKKKKRRELEKDIVVRAQQEGGRPATGPRSQKGT